MSYQTYTHFTAILALTANVATLALVVSWRRSRVAQSPAMWGAAGVAGVATVRSLMVELYSVATATKSTRPNYPPSDWLLEAGWQLPVLVDTEGFDFARAYGLSGFPYWVVLDGDGVVLTRISGRLGVEPVEALLANLAAR